MVCVVALHGTFVNLQGLVLEYIHDGLSVNVIM
jgi:hypothetical protein